MRIQIVLFYKLLYEIDLNMKQNTFLKLLYCDLWKRCRSHVNQGAQVDRRALPIHDTPQTTCSRSIDLSHVDSKCILHCWREHHQNGTSWSTTYKCWSYLQFEWPNPNSPAKQRSKWSLPSSWASSIRASRQLHDCCCLDHQWQESLAPGMHHWEQREWWCGSCSLPQYLERVTPGNNEYWRYPRNSDCDTSETELNQIMGIEPKYALEYSSRSQKLQLKNCAMIADYSLRVTLEQNLIFNIIGYHS